MSIEDLISLVQNASQSEISLEKVDNCNPQCISVNGKDLIDLMEILHSNEQLYFDSLSCITGIDLGAESSQMEIIYNLYSIPFDRHLMVKVLVDRMKPVISSVTSIWKAANWHEREVYDLLGIQFEDHPDLRRILLPADWEGFPLRKDYKEQNYYRGVKVKY